MTRIDFYQVSGDETTFTCRLIDKVYRLGHKIYIHTPDLKTAKLMDDKLWTFRPESFLPHCLVGDETHEQTDSPIRIGFDHEPSEQQEVLINLSGTVPLFFSQFARVAEVVPMDENRRLVARKNYTFYKDRGYELKYHKV